MNAEKPDEEPLFPPSPDGFRRFDDDDDDMIPNVEVIVAPKQGFGFWKAFLWCLLFLLLTQIMPALIIIPVVLATEWSELKTEMTSIQEELADADGKVDQAKFIERALQSRVITQIVQLAVLSGPMAGIVFSLIVLPRRFGRDWIRKIAFRAPHFEHVVLVVLLALPVLVFSGMLEGLLMKWVHDNSRTELEVFLESMRSWPAFILIMGIAVGPAISEELFCRGFLGHGLVSRYGTAIGITLTSIFFGAIHMNLVQGIFAALIGVVLHLVYIASRSILVPMLLHFINNFIVITSLSKEMPIPIGKSLEDAVKFAPLQMLIASVLMAGSIAWALYATRVRIYLPNGSAAPARLYPHVQEPLPGSANQAIAGPFPNAALACVITSTLIFAAIWFGI